MVQAYIGRTKALVFKHFRGHKLFAPVTGTLPEIQNTPSLTNMNNDSPKVIDLFSGVGGTSLGAARAGFSLALAVELDRHALAAHSLNFPTSEHSAANISYLTSRRLLELAGLAVGELDGLIGGPPCQGFSTIGYRNLTDPRNNLFVKFFKLVGECKPKFFVAENVVGILDDKYESIRTKAFRHLADNYVMLEPMRLKASDFGAPTSRERAFFVGYRSNITETIAVKDFDKEKIKTPVTVRTALQGLPRILRHWLNEEQSWRTVQPLPATKYGRRVQGCIPSGVGDQEALNRYEERRLASGCFGTRHSPEIQNRYGELRPGEQDPITKSVRLKLDGLCPTLRAGTGPDHGSFQAVRPIHPTSPRVITPREAARLQGFPDWFRFAPSKWHSFRQIGNSVSPILAEAIFKVIYAHLYSSV